MSFHPNIVMPRKGKDMSEYAERDIEEQDDEYVKHVHAMTVEDLHSKSAIAAELAHRDIVIKEQQETIRELVDALRPFSMIDFVRDSVIDIESKIGQRSMEALIEYHKNSASKTPEK